MPWNDNSNGGSPWGSGQGGNKGPWGDKPRGQGGGGRGPQGGGQPPADLEDLVRQLQARFGGVFGGGSGGGRGRGGGGFGAFFLLIAIAIIAWFVWPGSGWYVVDSNQRGVVLRFGKVDRVQPAGFHFKLPYPIEVAETPQTARIQTEEIGGTVSDSLMLTGDQNIVELQFDIQWEVGNRDGDVERFLFRIDNPQDTLRSVAESAMREVVGQTRLQPVLQNDPAIASQVRTVVQETLDQYEAGIRVVNVLVSTPNLPDQPVQVVARNEQGRPITQNGQVQTQNISPLRAFRDVQDARSEKETAIQNATAIANSIVPEARGRAERILAEGRAYRASVIAEARGEADRFLSIFEQYQQFPEVVRTQLHREAIERVLGRSDVIILDEGASGPIPYLSVNELTRSRTQSNSRQ